MNESGRVVLVVLGILLVVGMGIGGYYLGWYLDRVANANTVVTPKVDPRNVDSSTEKKFESTNLKISFTYPGNWKIYETTLQDNGKVSEVKLVSPSGSYFIYHLSDKQAADLVCGKANVECEYRTIDGVPFARHKDSVKTNSVDGEYWVVAESKNDEFAYNSSNGFFYQSQNPTDLSLLDNIMKSVVRK